MAAGKPDAERCRTVDACYDAIRHSPSDPSLLSALGDALLRANRPADALRTYQRVATLAPGTPGVAAKISALEAKLSAKRAPGNSPLRAASADATGKHYSNAAPETQSH
jgi:predicted Zn-dependent protease